MHLKNENETVLAINKWREVSPAAQEANLRKAIKTMELDQMYYDQKGSERGLQRCNACLKILWERVAEISAGDPQV